MIRADKIRVTSIKTIIGFVIVLVCLSAFSIQGQESETNQQATQLEPTRVPEDGGTDIASQIEQAKAQLQQDPQRALAIFEQVLQQQPDNVEILYYAGNLSLQLNRPEQGLRYLERSVELAPGNVKLALLLGRAYERFGTAEDAARIYKHVIDIAPESSDAATARQRLAVIAPGKKEATSAQAATTPLSDEELNQLIEEGKAQMQQDPQRALAIFEQVLQQQPDNAEVLYNAGNLSLQLNRPTQGLRYLQHTSDLNPDNTALLMLLAKAYEQFGTAEDATRIYKHVIDIAPESSDAATARQRLAVIAPGKEETTSAQAATTPLSDEELNQLIEEGKAQMQQDPQRALAIFEQVLQQQPDNAEVLYNAGNLSLQLNRPTQGLRYLQHTSDLNPDNTALLMLLAKAYEQFGTADDAARTYQHIIDIAPESSEAATARQRLEAIASQGAPGQAAPTAPVPAEVARLIDAAKSQMTQDPEGALKLFEQALKIAPDNPEALFFAGNLNLQLNRPDQGLTYLEHAVEILPDNTRLLMVLGQAYERFRTGEDAANMYQSVIDIAPGSREAEEANKRLQIVAGKQALSQGEPDKASQTFQHVVANHPDDSALLSEIIAIYNAGQRVGELQHFLEAVLPSIPNSVVAHSTLATIYDRQNDYPKTIEQLEQILPLLPEDEDPQVRQNISQRLNMLHGLAALQQQSYDEAREFFEKFLTVEPDNVTAKMNLATAYRGQGNLSRAIEILSAILVDDPDNLLVRLKLGASYYELDQLEDAARELEEVRLRGRNKPERKQAEQLLAPIYATENGKQIQDTVQTQMLTELKKRAEKQPDDFDLWSDIAFIHLLRQEFKGARDAYEEMTRIRPDDMTSHLILASLYNRTGNKQKSEELFLDIIEEHPDNIEARIELGALYIELERLPDAARQLEKAKIVGSGSPLINQAVQLLSQVYSSTDGEEIKQQIKDELIQPLESQVADEEDNYEAWSELAKTYLAFDMFDEAREAYENLVRLKPDDTQAQGFLAELYDRSNEYEKAEEAYQKTLELSENPEIRKKVEEKLLLIQGKIALSDNDLDLAKKRFSEAIEINPDNFLPHIFLAAVYSSQEKFNDSIREYERVVELVPPHAVAHYNLARVFEQVKRDEDAITEYQTALRFSLPEDFKANAERRINALEKRINGFTYSFNYSSTYLSNFNRTRDDPIAEYSHSLGGSIRYSNKLNEKPLYWGVILNASYFMYQNIQFDFLSMGASPYTNFTWKDMDYSASINVSQMDDFLHQTVSNKSSSVNASVTDSFRMRSLIPWLGSEQLDTSAPSSWQISISGRSFDATTSDINDSLSYSLGISLDQSIGNGWSWALDYDLTQNENTEDVGNDLAYIGNSLGLSMTKVLRAGLSVNGGYTFAERKYTNPDSATLFTIKRTNRNQRFSGGLNYFVDEKIRLFANISYTINESDLPTGFVFDPTDVGTAIGFQSTSLGDYTNLTVTTGIAFSL